MDLGFITIIVLSFCLIFIERPITAIIVALFLFLGAALIFASMNRTFISLSLIIIYLGAILVLVLFVIMLTHSSNKKKENLKSRNHLSNVLIFCILYKTTTFYNVYFSPSRPLNYIKNQKLSFIKEDELQNGSELEKIATFMYNTEAILLEICMVSLIVSLIVCVLIIQTFKFLNPQKIIIK